MIGDPMAFVRALRDAARTREGRALLRDLAGELRRADEEAAEHDPVALDVAKTLANARRQDANSPRPVRRRKKAVGE